MEDVNNHVANLRADVATFHSKEATLELARPTSNGARNWRPAAASAKKTWTMRRQMVKVSEAAVEQALQTVYADRVGLGLPAQPEQGRAYRGPHRTRTNYSDNPAAKSDLLRGQPSSAIS